MNKPLLQLPHADQQHSLAYSFTIGKLFEALNEFYLGIFIEKTDFTISWNNVYGFWDISVFFDDRIMDGIGSLKLREQRWEDLKARLPEAYGTTYQHTSRWPRHTELDGQMALPLEQTEGIRFWVTPNGAKSV